MSKPREPEALSEVRVAVAAALRDRRGGMHALARISRACVELLPVDGASVSVVSGTQHRETLYASDQVATRIEALQFSLGEGPCFEAFTTRSPVLIPDLAASSAAAWPVFAEEIASEQVGAIFAFPLQHGAIGIGAMDMYRRAPGWLSVAELTTALQVVDLATVALLGLREGEPDGDNDPDGVVDDEWLAALPRDRAQVHQATGMLIAEYGIPAERALARLRGYAFATGRLVDQVARDIVTRSLAPSGIGT